MSHPPFETEATEAGEQALAPGVRPITLADRLALRAAAPLGPRRNPYAEQKPCDLGLFDQAACDQLDLIDALRATPDRSGEGASPTSPKE